LTYLLYCKQKPVNGGDRRAFVCIRGWSCPASVERLGLVYQACD